VTDYAALLNQKNSAASMQSDAAGVQRLLGMYGEWIDKYRGGMPATWLAMIMQWESNGKQDLPGDAQLGEYGLYQIAKYIPVLFGYPESARLDPETNVALAVLEYGYEACRWALEFPGMVELGSADSWKLARMTFALGHAGSRAAAKAAGIHSPGDVYGDIAEWARSTGGGGNTKTAFRILSIDTQWRTAELANGGSLYPGKPELIPAPPSGPYTLPPAVAEMFTSGGSTTTLLLAVLGGVGLFLYLRRR
jgi:hypothetical protein